MILTKLQWRDVLGVLKVQGEGLDFAYLTQVASQLGIAEELSQVLGEAGIWGGIASYIGKQHLLRKYRKSQDVAHCKTSVAA